MTTTTDKVVLVTELLNGAIEAVNLVVPLPVHREHPQTIDGPIVQPEIGVLLGMTGGIRGRIVLEAATDVFSSLAEKMFGVAVEGEMLESFIGELGNMIGGNTCTQVSTQGILLDITPPTVIVGNTRLCGFSRAIRIPMLIDSVGTLNIILIIEE